MLTSVKSLLWSGVWNLSAWIIITTADISEPKAENVRWFSLDFKTVITWKTPTSSHKYSVWYAEGNNDWLEINDCTRISHSECDLTQELILLDRTYSADIRTEPLTIDYDYNPEEPPHTFSTPFNPYRESNISAATFTVEQADPNRVTVNITDPLTGIHQGGKQLTIRDVLKKDLQYKISYSKSGSTGKRDVFSDSSTAEVSNLDAGQSYCFMVAPFIPSRPKSSQHGAWSIQLCTKPKNGVGTELSVGAWVGIVFILLTVLIIIITVAVLCCRCCRQKSQSIQTYQTSASI